ncbi:uncharacterized protein BO95DRAFT_429417 [Aspergillus brunneoviolaceus CBS 621.78]|uniref:Uncharacterized protein n=1 Tax=Aspergillus brunneoviolaceus CBS 621.78 TaxID=1450534 RepID=A0ACD1GGY7_9EURO|nr:hypothetical protein BO95DRAFT_429417 [Aspergillus brunneoviolaceus CBS 621.78]RAH48501.1 hypothetical protein BO95DRAFT_429417 [Aspergillus brunneoviolaceus CBS 621.78]
MFEVKAVSLTRTEQVRTARLTQKYLSCDRGVAMLWIKVQMDVTASMINCRVTDSIAADALTVSVSMQPEAMHSWFGAIQPHATQGADAARANLLVLIARGWTAGLGLIAISRKVDQHDLITWQWSLHVSALVSPQHAWFMPIPSKPRARHWHIPRHGLTSWRYTA